MLHWIVRNAWLNSIFSNYSLLQAIEKYTFSSKSWFRRSIQNVDLEMLHRLCSAFIREKIGLPFLLLFFVYSQVKKQRLSLLLRLKTDFGILDDRKTSTRTNIFISRLHYTQKCDQVYKKVESNSCSCYTKD